jgi:hypothetical protein
MIAARLSPGRAACRNMSPRSAHVAKDHRAPSEVAVRCSAAICEAALPRLDLDAGVEVGC